MQTEIKNKNHLDNFVKRSESYIIKFKRDKYKVLELGNKTQIH